MLRAIDATESADPRHIGLLRRLPRHPTLPMEYLQALLPLKGKTKRPGAQTDAMLRSYRANPGDIARSRRCERRATILAANPPRGFRGSGDLRWRTKGSQAAPGKLRRGAFLQDRPEPDRAESFPPAPDDAGPATRGSPVGLQAQESASQPEASFENLVEQAASSAFHREVDPFDVPWQLKPQYSAAVVVEMATGTTRRLNKER